MTGEPRSGAPLDPKLPDLRDLREVSGLAASASAVRSLLSAVIDETSVVSGLLHLLDAIVDQVSVAPPLSVHGAVDTTWTAVLAEGSAAIVGPDITIDVIDDGGFRSATVVAGDLLCLSGRGPGIGISSAPPDPADGRVDPRQDRTTSGDDAGGGGGGGGGGSGGGGGDSGGGGGADPAPVGATVQILRDGETVVDVAIDHRGRIVDHLDVEGLTASWVEFYEREMTDALAADETELDGPDEMDAELLAASERMRERAERRRQEAAEAEATDDLLGAPDPAGGATHTVPDGGMSVWPAPDPARERDPAGPLAGGSAVRVDQQRGDWAEISTREGRTGWVDARRLIELAHPPT